MYLSTDGGDTWANVGLKDSKAIARIVVRSEGPEDRLGRGRRATSGRRAASAASS